MCTRLCEAEYWGLHPQWSVYPAVCLDKSTWLEAGKDSGEEIHSSLTVNETEANSKCVKKALQPRQPLSVNGPITNMCTHKNKHFKSTWRKHTTKRTCRNRATVNYSLVFRCGNKKQGKNDVQSWRGINNCSTWITSKPKVLWKQIMHDSVRLCEIIWMCDEFSAWCSEMFMMKLAWW